MAFIFTSLRFKGLFLLSNYKIFFVQPRWLGGGTLSREFDSQPEWILLTSNSFTERLAFTFLDVFLLFSLSWRYDH